MKTNKDIINIERGDFKMKKQYIKSCFTIFVLIMLCWSVSAFTQQNSIDQQRMNKDLRIMEGILDKLLQGNISVYYNVSGRTKAVYLPEFGIVFHIKQSIIFYNIQEARNNYESTLQVLSQKLNEQIKGLNTNTATELQPEPLKSNQMVLPEIAEALDTYSNQKIQEKEEVIEKLKEDIVVFFRNYASAIGQLQSQDKLVVLVDLNNSQPRDSGNDILIGWVLKQDVDRYRQGQIDESDFEKRVHFQFGNSESDINTDIGILLEIFDRAMDSSPYQWNSSNTGVYLEGLGALIFMEVPLTIPFGRVFMREENGRSIAYGLNGQRLSEVRDGTEDTGMEEDEYVEKIQNELFELIASYGHTLRLQSQEWIILNVNLGNEYPRIIFSEGYLNYEQKTPSRLILKLKKKDLDDYNRGAITLSSLKGRLVQQTF